MAEKYLKQVTGVLTEVEALEQSTGVPDAGKIPALGAGGRLDESFMPVGIGADISSIVAFEGLSAGNFVNIYNDTGVAKCRRADATSNGKHAHGFVLASVLEGALATVYHEGPNDQITGATPGDMYLSTTPGGATATPPSSSGNVVQKLGVATSVSNINVELGQRIVLA